MQKVVSDYGEKCVVWQETIFEPVKDVASNGVEIDCYEDLVAARQSHEELSRQVEQNIEELDKCIRFAEQARDGVRKAKRRPQTTTPARPKPLKRTAKTSLTGQRRRVVV